MPKPIFEGIETDFKVGDIVQITRQTHLWFPCLVIVSEVKSWGSQGYVMIPTNDGTGTKNAYIRPRNEQIEFVGKALILDQRLTEEEEAI